MNRYKKALTGIALVLAIVIIIGGVTAAAVSFGSKINEKKKTSASPKENSSGLSFITDHLLSEEIADVTETKNTDADVPDDIPVALWNFANENDLSLDLWPQEVIDMLIRYPETEEFVLNYPLLKDEIFYIDVSDSGYEESVPLFLQWDKRWGYVTYGDDMIANAGCGPTCLSMVACYLLEDPSWDPMTMAQFSTDYGYCCPGDGSYRSLIHEGGEIIGLDVETIINDEELVVNNLIAGYPVICAVGPGDFTTGGHYIVLADYIDGKIKVNDPNSIVNSEKLWEYDEIADQIEDLWVCSTY